jgi:hypothetical protein
MILKEKAAQMDGPRLFRGGDVVSKLALERLGSSWAAAGLIDCGPAIMRNGAGRTLNPGRNDALIHVDQRLRMMGLFETSFSARSISIGSFDMNISPIFCDTRASIRFPPEASAATTAPVTISFGSML